MHEEACSEKRAGRRRVNSETALGHLELTPNSKKQAQTLASDASLHCFDLPSTILRSTMTMPSCPSLLEMWLDGGERRRPSVSGQSSILCTRLRQPGCVRKCPLLRSTNGYRPPKTLFEARRSVSHLLTVAMLRLRPCSCRIEGGINAKRELIFQYVPLLASCFDLIIAPEHLVDMGQVVSTRSQGLDLAGWCEVLRLMSLLP